MCVVAKKGKKKTLVLGSQIQTVSSVMFLPLAKVSANTRIDELDQKWSDQFTRLEALLMA